MKCKKCNREMTLEINGTTQGWYCPVCGLNIVTSYIEDINIDETEYALYIKETADLDFEKIKTIAKISGVNYIEARKMLETKEMSILKAKAKEIKEAIKKLEEFRIDYCITPKFGY